MRQPATQDSLSPLSLIECAGRPKRSRSARHRRHFVGLFRNPDLLLMARSTARANPPDYLGNDREPAVRASQLASPFTELVTQQPGSPGRDANQKSAIRTSWPDCSIACSNSEKPTWGRVKSTTNGSTKTDSAVILVRLLLVRPLVRTRRGFPGAIYDQIITQRVDDLTLTES